MIHSAISSHSATASTTPRLRVSGVSRAFPGVKALDEVSLEIRAGEIHALVGENGAGKSTLMHIISGVYQPDSGQMELDGQRYTPTDERDAQQAGVAIVFQEGSLFAPLNVAENIFAGRQPTNRFGLVDVTKMHQHATSILKELDVNLSPSQIVSQLSPGQRQLVEIAKALSQQVRLLILDEPTSSLTLGEARHLFAILKRLANNGVGIIYVSHRLGEIFEIADRVTVLRDGRVTGVRTISATTPDELIQLEVGRAISLAHDTTAKPMGQKVVLRVENLVADAVRSANLVVHASEIVCLAGLVGAGRTELVEAIFGTRTRKSGTIRMNGTELAPHHPHDAMQLGIGMVPEDRRQAGLFLNMGIDANIAVANMQALSAFGLVNKQAVQTLAQESVKLLSIATTDTRKHVLDLSGGNQQKVLLARWLARKPQLLIVDEPTRGVDVGAKADVYAILRDLAHHGVALLVVSSDMTEVLALAHRIVVMAEGKTVGELDPAQANEITILQLATPRGVLSDN
jgi:ABC-type sugar transport system ATPase subunit